MITFYSGTPGSGKSLHVARNIYNRLVMAKKPVICSFNINMDYITKKGKRKVGAFYYVPMGDGEESMCVNYLVEYARKHHIRGKESQTLVVIDECQLMFNPREFSKKDRLDWINFFTQHRHLGFDFILVSQFDMLVDKQIRSLFEFDIKHRKLNNYGFTRCFPIPVFVAVSFWYCVKKKVTQEFFIYRRKYSKIYDSFAMWDKVGDAPAVGEGVDVPHDGEAPPRVVSGVTVLSI
jgi:zona occludens toxin (predicted ATPase)